MIDMHYYPNYGDYLLTVLRTYSVFYYEMLPTDSAGDIWECIEYINFEFCKTLAQEISARNHESLPLL